MPKRHLTKAEKAANRDAANAGRQPETNEKEHPEYEKEKKKRYYKCKADRSPEDLATHNYKQKLYMRDWRNRRRVAALTAVGYYLDPDEGNSPLQPDNGGDTEMMPAADGTSSYASDSSGTNERSADGTTNSEPNSDIDQDNEEDTQSTKSSDAYNGDMEETVSVDMMSTRGSDEETWDILTLLEGLRKPEQASDASETGRESESSRENVDEPVTDSEQPTERQPHEETLTRDALPPEARNSHWDRTQMMAVALAISVPIILAVLYVVYFG